MKIPRLEAMRRSQRDYHRSHSWRLSSGGLYVPHTYEEFTPDRPSTWDDVGFILNGRRVIVWWEHPGHVYSEAVWYTVWKEVGNGPVDHWLTEDGTPNYKRVGRSRKKLVSTTLRKPSPETRAHHDLLRATYERLNTVGIDHSVSPRWKVKRLWWAMGIDIVAPVEVRNERDLKELADLAKRLFKGQMTLTQEFGDYRYTREDWIRENKARTAIS